MCERVCVFVVVSMQMSHDHATAHTNHTEEAQSHFASSALRMKSYGRAEAGSVSQLCIPLPLHTHAQPRRNLLHAVTCSAEDKTGGWETPRVSRSGSPCFPVSQRGEPEQQQAQKQKSLSTVGATASRSSVVSWCEADDRSRTRAQASHLRVRVCFLTAVD